MVERLIGSALKVPLFHGLAPHDMSQLVSRAERVLFQPGDALIRNGEMGDAALLVITGRATQFNAYTSTRPYEPIGPGSLVGEMAMLIETTHHVTVVADETIKALRFSRPMIETLMAEQPNLADHFVRRIATRLNGLADEMRAALNTKSGPQTPAATARVPESISAHPKSSPASTTLPIN